MYLGVISIVEYLAYIAIVGVVFAIVIHSKQPRLSAFITIQHQNNQILMCTEEAKKTMKSIDESNKKIIEQLEYLKSK